ncbi:Hypothetical protein IALB_0325 [Ignavibacterium album JCM 16511]|uniref:Uncharacterized protein n=1 Tax=Ignavibacterium album (strain DSM 19864 / JCM 16511 / NBRC 101810 / Mat9-16) TaxID=945713 RepID=I0AGD0_IGNAJ|nr:hypothetical protein [Ignavibacterium album]AFH48037.1 Hypothetical protein IALB_0325 [Ignavibacterium album JCM 16511]
MLSEEITADELALESIASLFAVDEQNNLFVFRDSLKKWKPKVDNEPEAKRFLNSIIRSKVNQHIAKLLREADPFFSKLLDKVNYQIKKKSFKKIHYLGCAYIVPDDSEEICGKIIPERDFNQLPIKFFKYSENFINDLFQYLKEETNFAAAIPLNLLIFKLKDTDSSCFTISESTSEQIEERDIDSVVEIAIKRALEKLNDTYLQKSKLRNDELSVFQKTLIDIAFDLKNGGVNPGLHKYFLLNHGNLTYEEYKLRYQNILEYLFKLLKHYIAEELDR